MALATSGAGMEENGSVKEIAKASGAVVEFLNRIAGEPLEQLGGFLADGLKYIRFQRQIKIAEKARAHLASRGIEPRKVSLKVLAPILNEGSLEDDEDMAAKWAGLLATAADSTSETEVPPAFPKILAELSAEEAKFLERLFESESQGGRSTDTWVSIPIQMDRRVPGKPQTWYGTTSENLVRLGICQRRLLVGEQKWGERVKPILS